LSHSDTTISVVIATRDRRELLERVAGQLLGQLGEADELIVVDDSAWPDGLGEHLGARVSVLESGGRGPATARNLGWRTAVGDLVAFTDDDVLVDARWLEAIRGEFAGAPDIVAVEGRTVSRPFDPLHEYSVWSEGAGNGLTCNVAYRRTTLEQIGGFDEKFRFAHCEDVDLFIRARNVGPIRFCERMLVEHEPRPLIAAQFTRRGGWLASERRLYAKHRDRKPYPLPPAVCAFITYARWPFDYLIAGVGPSPLRDVRRLRRTALLTMLWWWQVAKAVPTLASGS
jgi:GT2 family glycosyltransferase